MNIDAHGGAEVHVKIFEPENPAPLAPAIERLVGCAFDNPKDREIEGDWVFSGRCAGAFRKRGLLVGGQFDFAPLMEILKHSNVERLDVIVRHPRSGFSQFLDSGWTIETTAQSVEYAKTLTPAPSTPPVRLAFGYRLINFLPISLLLFPVGLSLIMRRAALRARQTDPVVVWFTYWSLFGWMITGVWLLWIEGIHGAGLRRSGPFPAKRFALGAAAASGVLRGAADSGATGLHGSLGGGSGARRRGALDAAGFAEARILARTGDHLADLMPLGRRRLSGIIQSSRAGPRLPDDCLWRPRDACLALAAIAEAQPLRSFRPATCDPAFLSWP